MKIDEGKPLDFSEFLKYCRPSPISAFYKDSPYYKEAPVEAEYEISYSTLMRWYESLDGYDYADVPDTVTTRREMADMLGIVDDQS